MRFGQYLTSLRESRGFTKTDIAKRVGVSGPYFMLIESSGRKPPTDERLKKISEILSLTSEEEKKLFSLAKIERSGEEFRPYIEKAFRTKSDIIVAKIDEPRKFKNAVSVPLLGSCPASPLEWRDEEVEKWYDFPQEEIKGRRMYLLKVKGDSMNKLGIDDGDRVLVDADRHPKNGDPVIICVDHEFTLKRFYQHEGKITLMPDSTNGTHQPMFIEPSKTQVYLRGVVDSIYMKRIRL